MRRMLLVLLAALAAAGAGACGDDDGGGTADRLSAAEFLEQGNAICEAGNDRLDAAAEEAFADASDENPPTDDAILAFTTEKAIPDVEKQIGDLAELSPPEELQEDFATAMAEAQAVLTKVKDDPSLLAADDGTTFDKTNELLSDLGLEACAEG